METKKENPQDFTFSFSRRVRTVRCFNSNPALGKFDLIIGSDLLYDRDLPQQLAVFVERHSADNAEVIVLDPGRGNKNVFTRAMQALGFRFSEQAACRQQDSGEAYKGHFLTYTRGHIIS